MNCKIFVSGKNSVTINMNVTMPPKLVAEGAYCAKMNMGAGGDDGAGDGANGWATCTLALFSDGTMQVATQMNQSWGSLGYMGYPPCDTLSLVKKHNPIQGTYTLNPSTKTIFLAIPGRGDSAGAFAYSIRYNASIHKNQIHTIYTNTAFCPGANQGEFLWISLPFKRAQ